MKLIEADVYVGEDGHENTSVWVEDDATEADIREAILYSLVTLEIDWFEKETD